jgi:hypothetical protein
VGHFIEYDDEYVQQHSKTLLAVMRRERSWPVINCPHATTPTPARNFASYIIWRREKYLGEGTFGSVYSDKFYACKRLRRGNQWRSRIYQDTRTRWMFSLLRCAVQNYCSRINGRMVLTSP